MQPHCPFIGKRKVNMRDLNEGDIRKRIFLGKKDEMIVWDFINLGRINIEEAWKAYKSNLELVLKYVCELLEYLDGKTIITSDHGNCFGELGIFGHPARVYIPPLTEVPYLEIDSKSTKNPKDQQKFTAEEKKKIAGNIRNLKSKGKI